MKRCKQDYIDINEWWKTIFMTMEYYLKNNVQYRQSDYIWKKIVVVKNDDDKLNIKWVLQYK